MMKYRLENRKARKTVNLCDYRQEIIDAVHEVCPDAKVIVKKQAYYLPDDISRGDKIRIGRRLAKSDLLGCYSLNRPILFKGEKTSKLDKRKGV